MFPFGQLGEAIDLLHALPVAPHVDAEENDCDGDYTQQNSRPSTIPDIAVHRAESSDCTEGAVERVMDALRRIKG